MKDIQQIADEFVTVYSFYSYKATCRFVEEFISCFYFEIVYLNEDGSLPSEPPVVGGACGIAIDKKSKEVQPLSYSDLWYLKEEKLARTELLEKLNALKSGAEGHHLSWLKSKYGFSSIELLKFKKLILQTDLKRERIFEQVEEIRKAIDTQS